MKKPNKKIEVKKITIKIDHARRLSPAQRHVYYLLGHMANEFQTIQLLLIASRPSEHDERQFRIHSELSQTWFFIRLAAGKIFEATEAINHLSQEERDVLFNTEQEKLDWSKLIKQSNKTAWLGRIRNELSFHYPNAEAWQATEQPEESTWTDDEIFLTEDSARTFYQGSDSLLLSAVLQKIDKNPEAKTIGELLTKTTTWSKDFCDLLNRSMANFIERNFPDVIESGSVGVGTVLAQHINGIKLPFWYYHEMD